MGCTSSRPRNYDDSPPGHVLARESKQSASKRPNTSPQKASFTPSSSLNRSPTPLEPTFPRTSSPDKLTCGDELQDSRGEVGDNGLELNLDTNASPPKSTTDPPCPQTPSALPTQPDLSLSSQPTQTQPSSQNSPSHFQPDQLNSDVTKLPPDDLTPPPQPTANTETGLHDGQNSANSETIAPSANDSNPNPTPPDTTLPLQIPSSSPTTNQHAQDRAATPTSSTSKRPISRGIRASPRTTPKVTPTLIFDPFNQLSDPLSAINLQTLSISDLTISNAPQTPRHTDLAAQNPVNPSSSPQLSQPPPSQSISHPQTTPQTDHAEQLGHTNSIATQTPPNDSVTPDTDLLSAYNVEEVLSLDGLDGTTQPAVLALDDGLTPFSREFDEDDIAPDPSHPNYPAHQPNNLNRQNPQQQYDHHPPQQNPFHPNDPRHAQWNAVNWRQQQSPRNARRNNSRSRNSSNRTILAPVVEPTSSTVLPHLTKPLGEEQPLDDAEISELSSSIIPPTHTGNSSANSTLSSASPNGVAPSPSIFLAPSIHGGPGSSASIVPSRASQSELLDQLPMRSVLPPIKLTIKSTFVRAHRTNQPVPVHQNDPNLTNPLIATILTAPRSLNQLQISPSHQPPQNTSQTSLHYPSQTQPIPQTQSFPPPIRLSDNSHPSEQFTQIGRYLILYTLHEKPLCTIYLVKDTVLGKLRMMRKYNRNDLIATPIEFLLREHKHNVTLPPTPQSVAFGATSPQYYPVPSNFNPQTQIQTQNVNVWQNASSFGPNALNPFGQNPSIPQLVSFMQFRRISEITRLPAHLLRRNGDFNPPISPSGSSSSSSSSSVYNQQRLLHLHHQINRDSNQLEINTQLGSQLPSQHSQQQHSQQCANCKVWIQATPTLDNSVQLDPNQFSFATSQSSQIPSDYSHHNTINPNNKDQNRVQNQSPSPIQPSDNIQNQTNDFDQHNLAIVSTSATPLNTIARIHTQNAPQSQCSSHHNTSSSKTMLVWDHSNASTVRPDLSVTFTRSTIMASPHTTFASHETRLSSCSSGIGSETSLLLEPQGSTSLIPISQPHQNQQEVFGPFFNRNHAQTHNTRPPQHDLSNIDSTMSCSSQTTLNTQQQRLPFPFRLCPACKAHCEQSSSSSPLMGPNIQSSDSPSHISQQSPQQQHHAFQFQQPQHQPRQTQFTFNQSQLSTQLPSSYTSLPFTNSPYHISPAPQRISPTHNNNNNNNNSPNTQTAPNFDNFPLQTYPAHIIQDDSFPPRVVQTPLRNLFDFLLYEIEVLKYIHNSAHPKLQHVLRCFEIIDDHTHPNIYMIFEHIPNSLQLCDIDESLLTVFFRREKKRDDYQLFFLQMLTTLQGLQEIGVIHRDIRPANIYLQTHAQVVDPSQLPSHPATTLSPRGDSVPSQIAMPVSQSADHFLKALTSLSNPHSSPQPSFEHTNSYEPDTPINTTISPNFLSRHIPQIQKHAQTANLPTTALSQQHITLPLSSPPGLNYCASVASLSVTKVNQERKPSNTPPSSKLANFQYAIVLPWLYPQQYVQITKCREIALLHRINQNNTSSLPTSVSVSRLTNSHSNRASEGQSHPHLSPSKDSKDSKDSIPTPQHNSSIFTQSASPFSLYSSDHSHPSSSSQLPSTTIPRPQPVLHQQCAHSNPIPPMYHTPAINMVNMSPDQFRSFKHMLKLQDTHAIMFKSYQQVLFFDAQHRPSHLRPNAHPSAPQRVPDSLRLASARSVDPITTLHGNNAGTAQGNVHAQMLRQHSSSSSSQLLSLNEPPVLRSPRHHNSVTPVPYQLNTNIGNAALSQHSQLSQRSDSRQDSSSDFPNVSSKGPRHQHFLNSLYQTPSTPTNTAAAGRTQNAQSLAQHHGSASHQDVFSPSPHSQHRYNMTPTGSRGDWSDKIDYTSRPLTPLISIPDELSPKALKHHQHRQHHTTTGSNVHGKSVFTSPSQNLSTPPQVVTVVTEPTSRDILLEFLRNPQPQSPTNLAPTLIHPTQYNHTNACAFHRSSPLWRQIGLVNYQLLRTIPAAPGTPQKREPSRTFASIQSHQFGRSDSSLSIDSYNSTHSDDALYTHRHFPTHSAANNHNSHHSGHRISPSSQRSDDTALPYDFYGPTLQQSPSNSSSENLKPSNSTSSQRVMSFLMRNDQDSGPNSVKDLNTLIQQNDPHHTSAAPNITINNTSQGHELLESSLSPTTASLKNTGFLNDPQISDPYSRNPIQPVYTNPNSSTSQQNWASQSSSHSQPTSSSSQRTSSGSQSTPSSSADPGFDHREVEFASHPDNLSNLSESLEHPVYPPSAQQSTSTHRHSSNLIAMHAESNPPSANSSFDQFYQNNNRTNFTRLNYHPTSYHQGYPANPTPIQMTQNSQANLTMYYPHNPLHRVGPRPGEAGSVQYGQFGRLHPSNSSISDSIHSIDHYSFYNRAHVPATNQPHLEMAGYNAQKRPPRHGKHHSTDPTATAPTVLFVYTSFFPFGNVQGSSESPFFFPAQQIPQAIEQTDFFQPHPSIAASYLHYHHGSQDGTSQQPGLNPLPNSLVEDHPQYTFHHIINSSNGFDQQKVRINSNFLVDVNTPNTTESAITTVEPYSFFDFAGCRYLCDCCFNPSVPNQPPQRRSPLKTKTQDGDKTPTQGLSTTVPSPWALQFPSSLPWTRTDTGVGSDSDANANIHRDQLRQLISTPDNQLIISPSNLNSAGSDHTALPQIIMTSKPSTSLCSPLSQHLTWTHDQDSPISSPSEANAISSFQITPANASSASQSRNRNNSLTSSLGNGNNKQDPALLPNINTPQLLMNQPPHPTSSTSASNTPKSTVVKRPSVSQNQNSRNSRSNHSSRDDSALDAKSRSAMLTAIHTPAQHSHSHSHVPHQPSTSVSATMTRTPSSSQLLHRASSHSDSTTNTNSSSQTPQFPTDSDTTPHPQAQSLPQTCERIAGNNPSASQTHNKVHDDSIDELSDTFHDDFFAPRSSDPTDIQISMQLGPDGSIVRQTSAGQYNLVPMHFPAQIDTDHSQSDFGDLPYVDPGYLNALTFIPPALIYSVLSSPYPQPFSPASNYAQFYHNAVQPYPQQLQQQPPQVQLQLPNSSSPHLPYSSSPQQFHTSSPSRQLSHSSSPTCAPSAHLSSAPSLHKQNPVDLYNNGPPDGFQQFETPGANVLLNSVVVNVLEGDDAFVSIVLPQPNTKLLPYYQQMTRQRPQLLATTTPTVGPANFTTTSRQSFFPPSGDAPRPTIVNPYINNSDPVLSVRSNCYSSRRIFKKAGRVDMNSLFLDLSEADNNVTCAELSSQSDFGLQLQQYAQPGTFSYTGSFPLNKGSGQFSTIDQQNPKFSNTDRQSFNQSQRNSDHLPRRQLQPTNNPGQTGQSSKPTPSPNPPNNNFTSALFSPNHSGQHRQIQIQSQTPRHPSTPRNLHHGHSRQPSQFQLPQMHDNSASKDYSQFQNTISPSYSDSVHSGISMIYPPTQFLQPNGQTALPIPSTRTNTDWLPHANLDILPISPLFASPEAARFLLQTTFPTKCFHHLQYTDQSQLYSHHQPMKSTSSVTPHSLLQQVGPRYYDGKDVDVHKIHHSNHQAQVALFYPHKDPYSVMAQDTALHSKSITATINQNPTRNQRLSNPLMQLQNPNRTPQQQQHPRPYSINPAESSPVEHPNEIVQCPHCHQYIPTSQLNSKFNFYNGFGADLWSLSVSMFTYLHGFHPFATLSTNYSSTLFQSLQVIVKTEIQYQYKRNVVPFIKQDGLDFFRWIFLPQSSDRPSLDHCAFYPGLLYRHLEDPEGMPASQIDGEDSDFISPLQ